MSRPARALLVVVVAAACARAPELHVPEAPAPVADPCVVAGSPGRTPDTLDVVLDDPVNPSPMPGSGAEWLVFAQVYETLVRLDCTGAPRPALAAEWRSEDGGRAWTFTLRADAAFWDGAPLSADSIVAHWRGRPAQATRLAMAGVDSVGAVAERGIRLVFAEGTDTAPALLADPGLAPTLDRGGPWPVGAGAWRPISDPAGTRIALLLPSGAAGKGGPVLRVAVAHGDPRDALDAGADLLTTASPAALAYARTRPELTTVPLPWSRTYALASARPFGPAADPALRASLARDVVRVDARAAGPPFWWEAACGSHPPGTVSATQDSRIGYPAQDPAAGALASRLVALGAVGPGGAVLPLPTPELLAGIAAGRIAAAVLPLPRVPTVPCAAVLRMPVGWAVSPLVDTRAHLVTRRDGPVLRVDGFGAIRLDPAGMAAP